MAAFSYPNPIEALTPADAAEIQDNNDELVGYINTDVITRDGRVAMTAPLQLVNQDPLDNNDAARKSYVDAMLPVGTMMMYGAGTAPAGRWKLCDGSSLQIAAFPKLYAVLGTRYGGSTGTFKLPDLRHRVPIGVDSNVGRFSACGKTGGSWLVPVPSHTHGIDHNHGSINTGNQSASHKHKITHDHESVTTSDAVIPQLLGEFTAHDAPASGGSWFARRAGDNVGNTSFITESGGGEHSHLVNLPSYTGDSGIQDTPHNHSVDMPNFVGASEPYSLEIQIDSDPVAKTTTEHVPPYVVIAYIIRTD